MITSAFAEENGMKKLALSRNYGFTFWFDLTNEPLLVPVIPPDVFVNP